MAFPPVQTAKGSSATLPWSITFPGAVTGGNLIVVFGSPTGSGHVASAGLTDSLGNTYTHGKGQNDITGAGIDFWYTVSAVSGACTITFPSGITGMSLIAVAAEYHIAGIAVDQTNGTTNANIPFGVTTTQAVELILAGCTSGLQPTTWTITGGFINEVQADATPLQPCSIVLADLSVSAIGTYNVSFTGAPSFSANGIIISLSGSVPSTPTKMEISLLGVKRFGKEREPQCSEAPPEVHVKRAV